MGGSIIETLAWLGVGRAKLKATQENKLVGSRGVIGYAS
jgi:hypothetical protein